MRVSSRSLPGFKALLPLTTPNLFCVSPPPPCSVVLSYRLQLGDSLGWLECSLNKLQQTPWSASLINSASSAAPEHKQPWITRHPSRFKFVHPAYQLGEEAHIHAPPSMEAGARILIRVIAFAVELRKRLQETGVWSVECLGLSEFRLVPIAIWQRIKVQTQFGGQRPGGRCTCVSCTTL